MNRIFNKMGLTKMATLNVDPEHQGLVEELKRDLKVKDIQGNLENYDVDLTVTLENGKVIRWVATFPHMGNTRVDNKELEHYLVYEGQRYDISDKEWEDFCNSNNVTVALLFQKYLPREVFASKGKGLSALAVKK